MTKDQTREKILTVAARMFGKYGFQKTTVDEIARTAHKAKGSVYYYFKSKEDLLLTLLKEMNANLKFYLNKALTVLSDPRDKLLAFCDQAFDLVDKEKAALNGISEESIAQTLKMAVGGAAVDLLHLPREKEDVQIVVRLPQSLRTSPEDLLALRVSGNPARGLVPLRELVKVESGLVDKSIYHKNLMPVTYVIGDVAGVVESPVYAIFKMNEALHALDTKQFGGSRAPLQIYNATLPFTDDEPAIKWDGEWHITIEVFRDLGSAFAAVLVLIFILMVGWFRSFLTPLVVMAAIPFSLVGILPAHGVLGAFFTATSMIGFMAGAGIVVRNSIILVDFIEQRLAEGMPLDQAVVDAGAVRFRPMLLTALAVVVGASVILADPIFQGLAISLMAGEIASLLISRMAVPVLYFMARR